MHNACGHGKRSSYARAVDVGHNVHGWHTACASSTLKLDDTHMHMAMQVPIHERSTHMTRKKPHMLCVDHVHAVCVHPRAMFAQSSACTRIVDARDNVDMILHTRMHPTCIPYTRVVQDSACLQGLAHFGENRVLTRARQERACMNVHRSECVVLL